MIHRVMLTVCLASAIGCSSHSKLRLIGGRHGSVYLPLGTTQSTAMAGDEVILEIGRAIQSPDALGFQISINGQPGSPRGWWNTNDNMEMQSSNLEYRFRPSAPGEYHLECVTHYPGHPRGLLAWDITVTRPQ